MNADEVAALITYIAAIDPRARRSDATERQLQVAAWYVQLKRAEPADARAAVDAYFAGGRADQPPLPGDIRTRCVALANERADRRTVVAAIEGPALRPMPAAVREQVRVLQLRRTYGGRP